jgi:hypothetical protein
MTPEIIIALITGGTALLVAAVSGVVSWRTSRGSVTVEARSVDHARIAHLEQRVDALESQHIADLGVFDTALRHIGVLERWIDDEMPPPPPERPPGL